MGCQSGAGRLQGDDIVSRGEPLDALGLGSPGGNAIHVGVKWLQNRSDSQIVIEAVKPLTVPEGIGFLGFRIESLTDNDALIGSLCDPYPMDSFRTHPVEGYELAPKEEFTIVAAFRPTASGVFKFTGYTVYYRKGQSRFVEQISQVIEITSRVGAVCNEDKTRHYKG